MAAADAMPPCRVLVIEAEGKATSTTLEDFATNTTKSFWQKLLPPGKMGTLYIPVLRELEDRAFGLCDEVKLPRASAGEQELSVETSAVDLVVSLGGAWGLHRVCDASETPPSRSPVCGEPKQDSPSALCRHLARLWRQALHRD